MLPFGVTIPATVPQRSETPEGLMNYLVRVYYQSDYLKEYNVIGLYWEYSEDDEINEKFNSKT